MPMPILFDLFEELLHHRVKKLDYLVALGTHQPLNDSQLSTMVGKQVVNGKVGNIQIFNHEWHKPETFVHIGTIPANEIELITKALLNQEVPIHVNKLILNYDQILICGPVFPHEVAGFSGGNKYFFPGIAGPEIINFTHWLGALITNYKVIGKAITPVRVVIDRAAEFVKVPTSCFGLVVDHEGVAGLYFGSTKEAWQAAANLSGLRHIIYKDRTFNHVLSIMPEMYDDLWTAAKGMYKLEPVLADGGEIVIYAPHIYEVSYTHGKLIDEIGYHCRDYYLAQWDRFKKYPGGVLAHSTHLKGLGEYDSLTGIERSRIRVTLATSIPAERCQRINLGYLSPNEIDIGEWENREEEGILVVPKAGEKLYRIK
jgi:nickel-dependent lactate racemase